MRVGWSKGEIVRSWTNFYDDLLRAIASVFRPLDEIFTVNLTHVNELRHYNRIVAEYFELRCLQFNDATTKKS
ncbi:hypothetical protein HG15A2_41300 [Adhaeretor mobilis]|uniref:Uncharacterized protein n=1 Tax=Adhaeretor mobilis TaxID=1930276 RepID=A0A517N193_9BACT|nr:hypothetical protein HG15A2_41300 [Adhaeretor mobilis]